MLLNKLILECQSISYFTQWSVHQLVGLSVAVPCDGIIAVKRLLRKASLQDELFLTPTAMFDFCNLKIKSILFFYVSSTMV